MAYLAMPETRGFDDIGDSSSSDDSDIEVISTTDADEDALVRISNHLNLDSDASIDDDVTVEDTRRTQSTSDVRALDDKNHDSQINVTNPSHVGSSPSSNTSTESSSSSDASNESLKRKRRAWSTREKLHAIECYATSKSKHSTAKLIGCTRSQLTEWRKREGQLKSLRSLDNGESLIDEDYPIPKCVVRFLPRWTAQTTERRWKEVAIR